MDEPLILDRYRPLADLGEGGYGSVVLAFDTRMARRVAIKRLPVPLDRAGRPLTRTGLAEARTAALLNHPNIVTVHEWDTHDDEALIVMEYIDGLSLADVLDETRAPLNADEVAAVLEAVASALGYAHENGVLHLDLKPGNVLVTRQGRVKVADFGISALTDASGRARGTSGTIGYMPPEQLRNERLDERTDVWALGALVYELLTDANPFDADTVEGSLFKIEVADVPAPSEFEPSIPAELDDALLDSLEPEPFDRPRSARDLALAVLPLLGDPHAGRESLADLVTGLLGDEEPRDAYYLPEGVWHRLAGRSGLVVRAGAALAGAWLVATGVDALGLPAAAAVAGAGLAALAGALAPALGLALALVALALGVGATVGWTWGAALGVLGAAFWIARGRLGRGDAVLPMYGPLLAMARGGLLVPLTAGLAFRPLPAAIASAAAALLTFGASALTGGTPPWLRVSPDLLLGLNAGSVTPVTDSGTVVGAALALALVWAAAGATCAAFASRGTRLAGFGGALAGGAILAAGYAGWAALAGAATAPSTFVPELIIAGVVAIAAVVAGPPVLRNAEGDDRL